MSKVSEFFGLPSVRRIVAVLLVTAHALPYVVLPTVARQVAGALFHQGSFFEFAIVTVVSYALVSLGILIVVIGAVTPTWRKRTVNWAQLFLAGYLWPQILIAGFWCFRGSPSSFID